MNRYIQLMLKGNESYILKKLVKLGTTVHSLKYDEFAFQPFPLPPFEEQQRIIEKIKSLLSLCDQLEETIRQSEEKAGKLLQAVLREAVTAEKEVEDVL